MKIKLLLTISLILIINLGFGQITVPTNYTDLNSGNITLTNEILNDSVKWYKWTANDEIAEVRVDMTNNGVISQFSEAELYTY